MRIRMVSHYPKFTNKSRHPKEDTSPIKDRQSNKFTERKPSWYNIHKCPGLELKDKIKNYLLKKFVIQKYVFMCSVLKMLIPMSSKKKTQKIRYEAQYM